MYDELVKRLRELASIPAHCENVADCDQCSKEDICLSFTNERIIETATQAADAIVALCNLCASQSKDCSEAVAKYLELWAKQPRWIPVTERLPEEYVNVLCHLRSLDRQSEYYSIDHLMEDGQWWKAANSWRFEVTHWMPLPEPPKEE